MLRAVFFPAVLAASRALMPSSQPSRLVLLAAVLLQPAALLIDHGHFQYNCISLGLSVAAAAAILRGRHVAGSVLFSLALNHKQMSLFYAPAFFAHLLGRCLQRPGRAQQALAVLRLGAAVAATFVVCWAPWLTTPGSAAQVCVCVCMSVFACVCARTCGCQTASKQASKLATERL